MQGNNLPLVRFLSQSNALVIPVYQRFYDWEQTQCKQFLSDLFRLARTEPKAMHFFGCVTFVQSSDGAAIRYSIIDGQQRITTVTLLILALCHLVEEGLLTAEDPRLVDRLTKQFLIYEWARNQAERIKLQPIERDRKALTALFDHCPQDYDETSNLTHNYHVLREQVLASHLSADAIVEALERFEIVGIALTAGQDDPQRIFESLNSTGLALSEGDKIRNFLLMGLDGARQADYYEHYWTKIEADVQGHLDDFFRDFLSVKLRVSTRKDTLYPAFKDFASKQIDPSGDPKALLEDLRAYAGDFKRILSATSGLDDWELDGSLLRLNRLEVTPVRPFLLTLFRSHAQGDLPTNDLKRSVEMAEAYICRRALCEVPSSALTKVFLSLDAEVRRYDASVPYAERLAYALRSREGSSRLPGDPELREKLATRDIYSMRRQMRGILFERLECGHSRETKHVYEQLDKSNGCSIEHIMPQTLTAAWRETLGPDAEDIHRDWLHRLANLTLTAYNSKLSNRSFREKRDGKDGYRDSRFYLNAWIAQQETWGLDELKARAKQMADRVLEVWPMPETTFVPAEKPEEAFSLDDDPAQFTSRAVCRFQFRGDSVPVTSWAALLGEVALILYRQDARPLRLLLQDSTSETSLKRTFSATGTDLRTPKQLTEGLFLENNSSTEYKLLRLRELLDLYHADRDDLTFYLRPATARDPNDREAFLPNL